jgi:acyl-CoA synthetase (AMP-forming)/AMP-acid ligase II
VKDIIIRGGENIDSTSVENALFTDGVLEVAAVAVPDKKLGELVAAVVSVKPEYQDKITEESLIALARTQFVPDLFYERASLIFTADYLDLLFRS